MTHVGPSLSLWLWFSEEEGQASTAASWPGCPGGLGPGAPSSWPVWAPGDPPTFPEPYNVWDAEAPLEKAVCLVRCQPAVPVGSLRPRREQSSH